MKYRVIRDCHFVNRYWDKGEIANFPDGFNPCQHFEPYDGSQDAIEVPPQEPEVETMSGINNRARESAPKTGMAYTPSAAPEAAVLPVRRKPGRPPKS